MTHPRETLARDAKARAILAAIDDASRGLHPAVVLESVTAWPADMRARKAVR